MKMLVWIVVIATFAVACENKGYVTATPSASSTSQNKTCVTVKDGKTSSFEFYSESFDYCGFEAFKTEHQDGADATEEFFSKYAGEFPENKENIKVNGNLSIDGQNRRIQLTIGDNHKINKNLCTIELDAPIQKVTTNYSGYIAWVDSKSLGKATKSCLFSRFEEFNIFSEGRSVGFALDYWSSNEIRISLRDSYIFFKRE